MNNQPTTRFPAPPEIAAIVLALLPIICSFESYSYSTQNGEVVDFSYTDMGAIVLGIAAVVVSLSNIRLIPQTESGQKWMRLGAILFGVIVGAYQVARGLGIFIDPDAFVRDLNSILLLPF